MQEAEDCLAITMTLMEDMIPHAAKYFSGEKTFEPEFDDSTELDDEDEGIHIEESEDDNDTARCDASDAAGLGTGSPESTQECKQQ